MSLELERLYDAHAQALFAFVLNLLRSEADARDVIQDVFVKLASRPHALDNVRDERGFLIRMAHNEGINAIRRQHARESRHERFGLEAIFLPSGDAEDESFHDALATAMAELPPEQRAVLHLKIWEDFTFEAIATALDIPPNTAASRYRYAIDKLRTRLRPVLDDLK